MPSPVFITVAGQPVYHVRHDERPESPLLNYWYSLQDDGTQAVDVRSLPGYDEPEPMPFGTGTAMERSEYWVAALRAEAKRVIEPALAAGLFVSALDD